MAGMTTADTGPATDDPDPAVQEGRAVDAVKGDGHVAEACPVIGPGIVVLMVGGHAGHILSTPDVEAPSSHDPVHAAAAADHGGCTGPRPRFRIEDFVHSRFLRRQ